MAQPRETVRPLDDSVAIVNGEQPSSVARWHSRSRARGHGSWSPIFGNARETVAAVRERGVTAASSVLDFTLLQPVSLRTVCGSRGFEHIALMDHFFQVSGVGPAARRMEDAMLEAYTTLGFLPAHTRRAKLLTLVTGAFYRPPGILAKIVTTLDVLSGGCAILGIGAGWYEAESLGLDISFPSTSERFDHLEDALEVALRMWSEDESPYEGKLTTVQRPLNAPQALSRPHPPIMVGGPGEKYTLRYVAKYASCATWAADPTCPTSWLYCGSTADVRAATTKRSRRRSITCSTRGKDRDRTDQIVAELKALADLAIDAAIGGVVNAYEITPLGDH